MALDIVITDSQKDAEISLSLYVEDYDFIMARIEDDAGFPLLKRIFSDYYGEDEVYLNDLEDLKKEMLTFDNKFNRHFSKTVAEFAIRFLDIVDYAIKNKKTIKITGD